MDNQALAQAAVGGTVALRARLKADVGRDKRTSGGLGLGLGQEHRHGQVQGQGSGQRREGQG